MTRITTISSISEAPEAARQLLEGAQKKLGTVPNLFRVIANSPAALQAYVAQTEALAKGSLDAKTHERIALAVSEINGCGYCLAAHTYIARNLAKLDDTEVTANRNGASNDPKSDAAVRFAARIAKQRGRVSDAEVAAVKSAGFDDAQLVEIVAHVALTTLTNYVNEVAQTEIDFPAVTPSRAA